MALTPTESQLLATLTSKVASLEGINTDLLAPIRAAGQGGAVDIATHNTSLDAHAALFGTKIRNRLAANTVFYVRKEGSDSNDGLTVATAFATREKALASASLMDCAGFNVTINIGPGIWTGPFAITGNHVLGSNGSLFITGSGMTDCIFENPGGYCIDHGAVPLLRLVLSNFKVQNANTGIYIDERCGAAFSNIDFGAVTSAHLYISEGSKCRATGSYQISGSADYVFNMSPYSRFDMTGVSAAVLNEPTFRRFINISDHAKFNKATGTFTGAATGPRVQAYPFAYLMLNGAGLDSIPGTSDGGVDPMALVR